MGSEMCIRDSARTMRIPDLGHLAHEEDPEVFDAIFQEMVTKSAA